MSKWKMVSIEESCDILDNQRIPVTASDRKAGIYPYYGANGVQDYVDDYIFDDELVLLAEDGGNFGSIDRPIAYRVSGKCWVNNHAHVLKPKEGLDVDYLCYSLMFYDVSDIVNGATRQKLNQAAMRKMQISLPPLEEQKRIVNILDKASNLIDLRKQQLEKMDLLIKSKFIDMFGDPATNPKGWEAKKIGELTNVFTGATPNKSSDEYYGGNIPWVKTGEIFKGYIREAEEQITKKALKETNCKILPVNTIMVAMYGQGKTRGQAGLLKIEASTNQACAAILPNESYCTEYLFKLIKLSYETLRSLGRGGNQPNLNLSMIKEFLVMWPPIPLQNQFAEFVEQVEKQKTVMQQSLEKMETNYKALMQEYFG